MANKSEGDAAAVATWAKRCYFAGRALMEDALRPHGLGATQWYVLHRLTQVGPTMQRELTQALQVERATLSIVVAALVRKGLVEQAPDPVDQRRKLLRVTSTGQALWDELPDLTFIREAAFAGFSKSELETAARVLRVATERLGQKLIGEDA